MDIQISDRQKELLETEAVAVATLNSDGSPNLIAVGYVRVVSSDEILITDNFMKHTPENIQLDSRICLATWTKDWEEGYKFVGNAEYFSSGKWVDFVKAMEVNKELPAKGAILVTVNEVHKLG